MKVFVSHGAHDTWIACQMARCIVDQGADTFIDAYDIAGGDAFEAEIKSALTTCDELVALVTPFAIDRAWLHHEIGAVWMQNKRFSAILYGLSLTDMAREKSGVGLLTNRHIHDLNNFDHYLKELNRRCRNEP